jgi:gluconokinase
MVVIVMGVSGSGKLTVGECLARSLNWDFCDADSFHPKANVAKMSRSVLLEDSDRLPWLLFLQQAISEWLRDKPDVILACSTLKEAYRQILVGDRPQVKSFTSRALSSCSPKGSNGGKITL